MKLATLAFLVMTTAGSYATTIIVTNNQGPTATDEITNSAGTLVTGFGAFGILSEAAINGINTTYAGLNFTQWGTGAGSVTTATTGQFSFTGNVDPTPPSLFADRNVYLLVGFGGTSLASSTELFIYKFTQTFGNADSPTPITLTLGNGDIGTTLLGTQTATSPETSVGRFGSSAITAVPEPSAALLGAIGALGLLRRRRN